MTDMKLVLISVGGIGGLMAALVIAYVFFGVGSTVNSSIQMQPVVNEPPQQNIQQQTISGGPCPDGYIAEFYKMKDTTYEQCVKKITHFICAPEPCLLLGFMRYGDIN